MERRGTGGADHGAAGSKNAPRQLPTTQLAGAPQAAGRGPEVHLPWPLVPQVRERARG